MKSPHPIKPGYAERDGYVVLTMTQEDFQRILLAIGLMGGFAAADAGTNVHPPTLALANRLNDGNPDWAAESGKLMAFLHSVGFITMRAITRAFHRMR